MEPPHTPRSLILTLFDTSFGTKNGVHLIDLFVKPKEIDYRDGIIDYVFKQTLNKNLLIAVKGSNLDWRHLHRHYADLSAEPALM